MSGAVVKDVVPALARRWAARLTGTAGPHARIVPPHGFTHWLTFSAAAAMALLAVFALALSLAAGQVAQRWSDGLARSATVRIAAPETGREAKTEAVLALLAETPGVAEARLVSPAEQGALLAPWLGSDLPLDLLPMPLMVELVEDSPGFDPDALRQRLAASVPEAVLDDHSRWRRPLTEAAGRLRLAGQAALALIALVTAAMVVLAAQASLSANRQVIRTLRLIGADDSFIAGAFVRRFVWRTALGAAAGTLAAMLVLALLPRAAEDASLISGLGLQGWAWLLPLMVPPLAGVVAYSATKYAAFRTLRETT